MCKLCLVFVLPLCFFFSKFIMIPFSSTLSLTAKGPLQIQLLLKTVFCLPPQRNPGGRSFQVRNLTWLLSVCLCGFWLQPHRNFIENLCSDEKVVFVVAMCV